MSEEWGVRSEEWEVRSGSRPPWTRCCSLRASSPGKSDHPGAARHPSREGNLVSLQENSLVIMIPVFYVLCRKEVSPAFASITFFPADGQGCAVRCTTLSIIIFSPFPIGERGQGVRGQSKTCASPSGYGNRFSLSKKVKRCEIAPLHQKWKPEIELYSPYISMISSLLLPRMLYFLPTLTKASSAFSR